MCRKEDSMKNTINPKDLSRKTKTQKALLNPLYTFENFVVGDSNNFAFLAAKSICANSEILYNPLFIQGGMGIGKTHLMHAVGNIMQSQGKKVIYVTVESFLCDFMKHLSSKTMDRFRLKYHKCDLLLIDDIQSIIGKSQTQEELFHIIEALRANNKQIVLTSNKTLSQFVNLDERLKSRFVCGLIVAIKPAELETKKEIIKKKCEIKRLLLDDESIHYIATAIENNPYEIEGVINKLSAYSELMGVDVTIDFIKNILQDQIAERHIDITIDLIMDTVAKALNVKTSEIRSKSQNSNIVDSLHIAIYLARTLTPSAMPELAQYFGMKDHAEVSRTLNKINERIKNDEDFRVKLDELTQKVSSCQREKSL